MDLDSRLTHVAVIGAAGKMGSGITLLMAQEMARLTLLPENKGKLFRLAAIDLDPEALRGLQDYIHSQAVDRKNKLRNSSQGPVCRHYVTYGTPHLTAHGVASAPRRRGFKLRPGGSATR